MGKIPRAYLDIIERIYNFSRYGRVTTQRLKWILGCQIRFNKKHITGIITDLIELGLIEYKLRYIEVKWRPQYNKL